MRKAVGQFEVKVDATSPCRIEINDATGGAIRFDAGDLRDLEHAVLCAIRQVEDLRAEVNLTIAWPRSGEGDGERLSARAQAVSRLPI